MIVIVVLKRFEPAMKKGVLYAVYQIWDNAFQSESKPLFAFLSESEAKAENLPDLIHLTFAQILIDETVSYAIDWLRIDANDLLTDIPIAHLIPHHRSGYTLAPVGT